MPFLSYTSTEDKWIIFVLKTLVNYKNLIENHLNELFVSLLMNWMPDQLFWWAEQLILLTNENDFQTIGLLFSVSTIISIDFFGFTTDLR